MTAGDIYDYEYPEGEVNSRINLLSYNYNVSGDPVNYPPAIEADYYEVDSHSLYAYSNDNTRGFMDEYIGKLVGEGWAESYNDEFGSYTLVPQDEDYLLEIYFDKDSKRAVIDYQATKLDPTPEPVESDYWEASLIESFFTEYGQSGFIIPEPTNFSDVKYTYYEDINNSYCQHEGFEHLMCFYIEAEGVTQEEYQVYTLNLYFNEGWQINDEPLYFYKDVGDGCGKMEITYNEDTNFLMFKVYIYTFYMHYTSWPSEVIRNNLLAYNSDFTDTLPVFTGSFDYNVTYTNVVEIHSEYAYEVRLSYENKLSVSGFTEIDHGTDHFRSPNEKYDVFLGLFEDYVKVEVRVPEDSGHGETTTNYWPSELLYEALKGAYGLIPTIEDADEYILYIGGDTEEPYGDITCKYFNKTQNEIISIGETYIERLENEGFYKVNENGYADAGDEIYLAIIYEWTEEYGYVVIFFDTDVAAHK